MMQTDLFFCETKMGFSEYSVFWKVGSGFETLTSRMAPLNERIVQKHKASEGGTKHYHKQWCYFMKGHMSLLKCGGFGLVSYRQYSAWNPVLMATLSDSLSCV